MIVQSFDTSHKFLENEENLLSIHRFANRLKGLLKPTTSSFESLTFRLRDQAYEPNFNSKFIRNQYLKTTDRLCPGFPDYLLPSTGSTVDSRTIPPSRSAQSCSRSGYHWWWWSFLCTTRKEYIYINSYSLKFSSFFQNSSLHDQLRAWHWRSRSVVKSDPHHVCPLGFKQEKRESFVSPSSKCINFPTILTVLYHRNVYRCYAGYRQHLNSVTIVD